VVNKKTKTNRPRTPAKGRDTVPARRVQEMLLELTYRLHATRPLPQPHRPTGSVA
jgi:hypothetical protein